MSNYFYFKSLSKPQEKEVRSMLEYATARIADGVINSAYPFMNNKNLFSVYDSKSEEILYSFDKTTDKVMYIGLVKKDKYEVSLADAKKSIVLLNSDGSEYKEYNINQADKNELNEIYLKLQELVQQSPNAEMSIVINGKSDPEMNKKSLVTLAPIFKSKIDQIVLEAQKETGLRPLKNEYGVWSKTVNTAIKELSQKLNSNGLYTSEEFNKLVENLKQGKIEKKDFDRNCDQLIAEYIARNKEYDSILAEFKNSEQYKSSEKKDELNILLDKLNLRHKYVYDKATKVDIGKEFYATIANFTINAAKDNPNVSAKNIETNNDQIIYNYLVGKDIVTGKDTNGEIVYNTSKFDADFIEKVKAYKEAIKSFEKFRSRVDQLLAAKKTKVEEDIRKTKEWINQNFRYSKLPEQLAKVQAEVEKGTMTYEEFMKAYWDWSDQKYGESEEEKIVYRLYFCFFRDTACEKIIPLKGYTTFVKEFPNTKRGNNAYAIKSKSDDSLIAALNKKIDVVSRGLSEKYEDKYLIQGIMYKVSDGSIDNTVTKKFGSDNINTLKNETAKNIRVILNALVNEDEEDNDSFEVEE